MLDNVNMTSTRKKPLRCAIYTRKSHEEGLEQEFNSLDAQREAAEAYIESQRMLGWRALPDRYDDGGFSGGNMERPALLRLLADVDAGKVDVIVVYKIDRLSRSLLDFMNMIELFNKKGVNFVSVTEHFNTTDPTGRMFLGILITFAQYEREVIAERIRDKVAAAKRRGKYCGGPAILGYDVDRENKKLLINPDEAPLVQHIFRRFTQLASARKLARELNEQGYKTKSWVTKKGKHREGTEWNTGHIYRLLGNRIYIGEVVHKGESYPGEHQAIVEKELWEKVQTILSENTRAKLSKAKTKMISPLQGVIRCGHCDCSMGPTYTQKGERRYTYYICEKDAKRAVSRCPLKRVPAGDIEKAVLEQLGAVFRTPTLVAKTYFAAREMEEAERERLVKQKEQLEEDLAAVRKRALELMSPDNNEPDREEKLAKVNQRAVTLTRHLANVSARLQVFEGDQVTERDVSEAFESIETFWEDLFPLERNRLVRLLVERVEIRETGIDMELKTNGLTTLITELTGLACEVRERRNGK
jgi:site-specific DNA recombinase